VIKLNSLLFFTSKYLSIPSSPLSLKEGCILKLQGNKVLREMLEAKKDEVSG